MIHYVGDLDSHGLDIALKVQTESHRCELATVLAAPGMHKAMLTAASSFGFPRGWPVTDEPTQHKLNCPTTMLLSFLDDEIRPHVQDLLEHGRRIPEEVLGPTEMRAALVSRKIPF